MVMKCRGYLLKIHCRGRYGDAPATNKTSGLCWHEDRHWPTAAQRSFAAELRAKIRGESVVQRSRRAALEAQAKAAATVTSRTGAAAVEAEVVAQIEAHEARLGVPPRLRGW